MVVCINFWAHHTCESLVWYRSVVQRSQCPMMYDLITCLNLTIIIFMSSAWKKKTNIGLHYKFWPVWHLLFSGYWGRHMPYVTNFTSEHGAYQIGFSLFYTLSSQTSFFILPKHIFVPWGLTGVREFFLYQFVTFFMDPFLFLAF